MRVGCGIADVTGVAFGNGMMGYSMPQQRTGGIHLRLRARAFIVDDGTKRVVFVSADLGMIFDAVRQAVLAELSGSFGSLYGEQNVLLTATHTHAGPGGFSHHLLYNLAPLGFHEKTFRAVVTGIVAAIGKAHDAMAPGSLAFGQTELWDASVNRSRPAFDLNPLEDQREFPRAIDPAMTVLRFRQGSTDVGAISFFATHGTSMTNTNRLISGDNKGYAAYRWEHDHAGVRYSDDASPFVAAFPQTNAGDMSPNLHLKPGTGPTRDEFTNTQMIGDRQFRAALSAFSSARPLVGGVDSRLQYVDMSDVAIDPAYTPDGKPHRTSSSAIGLPTLAGSVEDGPGIGIPEGLRKPFASHDRRIVVLPSGRLGWTPNILPLQIMRIGALYLVAGPAEFTIVAGLRIRTSVAAELRVNVDDVLLVGYSNAYSQYVTTPEEYDSQQYEGGSTLFGRYTLCAYQQEFVRLARDLTSRAALPKGQRGGASRKVLRARTVRPRENGTYGQVLTAPSLSYPPGATVVAEFSAAHPANAMCPNYVDVEHHRDGRWVRIADDGDWETRVAFTRRRRRIIARAEWTVPADTCAGTYRIVYHAREGSRSATDAFVVGP
ncbi:neutral/alkaline non-lysosomal ceramidase N-terminal domain-containing protein [Hoyosella altamirensis]|nr:neutral/alkaline non-lysosomal ceramidase N-terminal domain-containing protein [Hoyosella altamirensis]